jgi:MraZ protein
MAVFVGEFETTIDSKHRCAISSALRDQIIPEEDGSNFYLVLGPDRHLWLYPDQYYRRLLGQMRRSALPDRTSRKVDLLFALSRVVKPDSQGRVTLPEKSLRRATTADKVTLVGKGDHVEIWPTDEWDEHIVEMLPNYGEMLYEAADRLHEQQSQD